MVGVKVEFINGGNEDPNRDNDEKRDKPAPPKGRAKSVSTPGEITKSKSRDELVFEAKRLGIKSIHNMNKVQLQNAINEKTNPKPSRRGIPKKKLTFEEKISFDPTELEAQLQSKTEIEKVVKEGAKKKAKKDLKQLKTESLNPEKQRVIGFSTSKGSVYELENNSTIRTKSEHQFHDPSDIGQKEKSDITYYVDKKAAGSIGMIGGVSGTKRSVIVQGENIYPVSWNEKENKWGIAPSDKGITFSREPKEGLYPIELWQGNESQQIKGGIEYSKWHAGNKITELKLSSSSQTPVTEPTPSIENIQPPPPPPPIATGGIEPEGEDEDNPLFQFGESQPPAEPLTENVKPLPPNSLINLAGDPTISAGRQKQAFTKNAKKQADKEKQQEKVLATREIGQIKRRALLQAGIQKRREILKRRREREAISERVRIAKSQIKEQYDRGESDRLIRRLATFGIGRAVGIDGGMITALAEIMLFQPEIKQAEQAISELTLQADQKAKEEYQELERSKTATNERRAVQSLDIQELIENAKMQAALTEEPVDVEALKTDIEAILNRGVVDTGQGIPQPITGQKPGPATEVFPGTREYQTASETGSPITASGTPNFAPGNASGGGSGGKPPGSGFGGFGGSFGGFGGGQSGGSGGTGGSGNTGGLMPAMSTTTAGLLQLTVGLTALASASQIATEGLSTVGQLMVNPQNANLAVQAGGSATKAGTTGISAGIGLLASGGNPMGALGGVIIGKAIGTVIIDPIVETLKVGVDSLNSVVEKSLGSETTQARIGENINLLLKQLEQGQSLDPITADFVEARTELSSALMDLKTAFINAFGDNIVDVIELLTKAVNLLEYMTKFFGGGKETPVGDMFGAFNFGFAGLAARMLDTLISIATHSEDTAKNTAPQGSALVQSINDFFMGKLSQEESIQGSFGNGNSVWQINQNMASI
jgi:hypothetical protein